MIFSWYFREKSYFCTIYPVSLRVAPCSKCFRINYLTTQILSYHGLRNYWLLRGLWHLPARLPRWRNLWRRHLPHWSRYLHRMWLLRWSMPQRSYHPRRIIRQLEVSKILLPLYRWKPSIRTAAALLFQLRIALKAHSNVFSNSQISDTIQALLPVGRHFPAKTARRADKTSFRATQRKNCMFNFYAL